ncbi:glycosyltransferase family 2 protein [Halalkalicoccus salilacus]|uniref:glycosyltransferase family 2 protein n=1 Tax=Halalkalicoccus salilacus TaxID=3117459 RepID=UPI0038D49756
MADTQRDPLVSVVVPTYDRPTAVTRAVRSVLNQTYRPIELIVVDDHSPRPVADALQPIDDEDVRVIPIRHEENRGGNAARNTGLEAATGEFIAFLDDDDEWLPEKLERQIVAIDHEDAGFAYTAVRNVDPDGNTVSITSSSHSGAVTKQLLFGNFIGTFSAVMVRRSVIEQAGLLDERLPSWQDWEYYVRLSRYCRCAAVPEPLVVRHNAPTGQISRSIEPKREISYPLLLERLRPIAREYDVERKMDGYVTYALGRAALSNGDYAGARRDFIRSITRYPFEPSFYLYLAAAAGGRYAYPTLRAVKRHLTRLTT